MSDTTLLFVLVLVTLGLVLLALAQPAQVTETEDYVWTERGATVIPGFLLGIPTSQLEFQAVKVRKADVELKRGRLLDRLNVLLDGKKDMVLLLTARTTDGKEGALLLAVSERLQDYAARILAQLGLGEPSTADVHTQVAGYKTFIFYGGEH